MYKEDSREYMVGIEDFSGGLNQEKASQNTPNNCSKDCQNCSIEGGVLSRGFGFSEYFAPETSIGKIGTLMVWHGVSESILIAAIKRVDGVDIYRLNEDDWVKINTISEISDERFAYINYQDGSDRIVIMGNGVDHIQIWDGLGNLELLYADDSIGVLKFDGYIVDEDYYDAENNQVKVEIEESISPYEIIGLLIYIEGEEFTILSASIQSTVLTITLNTAPLSTADWASVRAKISRCLYISEPYVLVNGFVDVNQTISSDDKSRLYNREVMIAGCEKVFKITDVSFANVKLSPEPVIGDLAGKLIYPVDMPLFAPKAKQIAFHFERIWLAGTTDNPQTLYYSGALNPSNWEYGSGLGGEINIQTWDGDRIIGIANIFDDIVIFNSHSIFRLLGTYPDEYQLSRVFSTAGLIAPRTICQYNDKALFLSEDGIMAFDGVKVFDIGSVRIREFWGEVNKSAFQLAVSIVYKGVLYLALPISESATNNCLITYNLETGSFMLHRDIAVDSFLIFNDELLFTDGETDSIFVLCGENLNGSDISMQWSVPVSLWQGKSESIKPRRLYISGWGGNVNIQLDCDGIVTNYPIVLPARRSVIKQQLNGSGRDINMKIKNVDGSDPHVAGISIVVDKTDIVDMEV